MPNLLFARPTHIFLLPNPVSKRAWNMRSLLINFLFLVSTGQRRRAREDDEET